MFFLKDDPNKAWADFSFKSQNQKSGGSFDDLNRDSSVEKVFRRFVARFAFPDFGGTRLFAIDLAHHSPHGERQQGVLESANGTAGGPRTNGGMQFSSNVPCHNGL